MCINSYCVFRVQAAFFMPQKQPALSQIRSSKLYRKTYAGCFRFIIRPFTHPYESPSCP
ncbi:hypothetical protein HMPREF9098_1202 [Kingella denitrificans ATCC 33394]|uniref:Uncharacterized protein n=1 Tax=Kingella denitrificans ATCC 33394 TaxID=888741 RepID=F0EZB8_9NEIS|nr:hypothetical protein HMPREF9098_1202 [Kingella denitrificans ATCC 33394]